MSPFVLAASMLLFLVGIMFGCLPLVSVFRGYLVGSALRYTLRAQRSLPQPDSMSRSKRSARVSPQSYTRLSSAMSSSLPEWVSASSYCLACPASTSKRSEGWMPIGADAWQMHTRSLGTNMSNQLLEPTAGRCEVHI